MIVVDASALVHSLLATAHGSRVDAVVRDHEIVLAPEIVDVEVATHLRRRVFARATTESWAGEILRQLEELIPEPLPVRPFMRRAWQMRSNVTVADALYVAVAEAFACPLLTADARLQRGAAAVSSAEIILC